MPRQNSYSLESHRRYKKKREKCEQYYSAEKPHKKKKGRQIHNKATHVLILPTHPVGDAERENANDLALVHTPAMQPGAQQQLELTRFAS